MLLHPPHRTRGLAHSLRNALFCLVLVLSGTLTAQEAEVHGTISSIDGDPLIGAYVRVVGSVVRASSDVEGRYRIEVPPGRIRLEYSYLGFQNFDTVLRVAPLEREIVLNVILSDEFSELGEIVVTGRRATGQVQALRNQQSAINSQTIVHAELFNQYPDITMAETAARLPGVSILRNQQDGEIVQLRGLPEQYTAVHLNGHRLSAVQPQSEQGGSLDLIPSNLVEEVRVKRTRTADEDGDAIAGSVDFRLRQPEERFEFLAQGGYGDNFGFDQNPDQKTGITQFAGALNSEVADEKVYVLLAGSYFRHGRGTRNDMFDYRDPDNPTLLTTALPFDEDRVTTRQGYLGAVELRPSIYNRLRLSYSRTEVEQDVIHRQLITERLPAGGEFTTRETSSYQSRRNLAQVTLEAENNFPSTRLDYKLSFNTTSEDLPGRRRDFLFAPESPVAPADLGTLNTRSEFLGNLPPISSRQELIRMDEDIAIGSFNVTRFLNSKKTQFLRAGGRYRSKDRAYGTNTAEQPAAFAAPETLFPTPNTELLSLPADGTDPIDERYQLKQRISAGYLMYAANFSSRVSASAGLRYEHIRVTAEPVGSDTLDFNESNILPSLNLTYRVRQDRQIRLGVSQTLGYPNYTNYLDLTAVDNLSLNKVVTGNPTIQQIRSTNLDLTFERYGRRDGLLAVGTYLKFLDDPTIQNVVSQRLPVRYLYESQTLNAGKASIVGFEAALYQSLAAINAKYRFFNVNATFNFNLISADAGEVGDFDEDDFTLAKAPRTTGNLSLVYSNPNRGFNFVLAGNYRGRVLDYIYDGRLLYRNNFFSLDLSVDKEVYKGISVYGRLNNLTDHSFEEWFGQPEADGSVLRSRTTYGVWGLVGVRYRPEPKTANPDAAGESRR